MNYNAAFSTLCSFYLHITPACLYENGGLACVELGGWKNGSNSICLIQKKNKTDCRSRSAGSLSLSSLSLSFLSLPPSFSLVLNIIHVQSLNKMERCSDTKK